MVSDLKIEIFAYNLFYMFFHATDETKTKPNILKIFGEESKKVDYEEICDELFFPIICFRHVLFNQIYKAEFTDEKAKSLKSTYGCYRYVISACDRDDLFGHLTIFQRMFATLNFVQFICFELRNKSEHAIDVVKYGYLFWAMYFDKYTEEFYEKGGWNELRKDIKLYVKLSDFAYLFSDGKSFNIPMIKEACFNYRHFKNASNNQERKQKHPVHISYMWIKYRIEHFRRYINIPLSYESSVNVCEAEQLLEDLKQLLNPSTYTSEDIELSREINRDFNFSTEIHSASDLREANQDNKTQIQQLSFENENRITDKIPVEILHKLTGLKDESLRKSQTFTMEELIPNIVHSNLNEELHDESFREWKEQDEIENTNQLISKYQVRETERQKQTCLRDYGLSTLSEETIDNFNGKVNHEKHIEIKVDPNSENQSEFLNTIDGTYSCHIGTSDFDGLSPLKDLSVNEIDNSDDERKIIKKAQEDLRKEREDPKVKTFLKLLLVLGDKENAEFVFSTLQCKEETLVKQREDSNKQEKRPKKKKHRK